MLLLSLKCIVSGLFQQNIKFWIKKKYELRNMGVVYNTRSHDQSDKTPSLFSSYAIENSSLWVSMSHHVLQSTYFTQIFSFIKHNNIQTKFELYFDMISWGLTLTCHGR